jgi:hypothetical protein
MLIEKNALNAKHQMLVNSSTHKRLAGWKGTLIPENKLVSNMLVF